MKILDATAADRAMWYNKENPLTTFVDVRPEMKPNIVMDITKPYFQDKEFDLIIFDPPHIPTGPENTGVFAKKYGRFSANQIRELIRDAFNEFYRILKDEGLVIFKFNDHSFPLKKVILQYFLLRRKLSHRSFQDSLLV